MREKVARATLRGAVTPLTDAEHVYQDLGMPATAPGSSTSISARTRGPCREIVASIAAVRSPPPAARGRSNTAPTLPKRFSGVSERVTNRTHEGAAAWQTYAGDRGIACGCERSRSVLKDATQGLWKSIEPLAVGAEDEGAHCPSPPFRELAGSEDFGAGVTIPAYVHLTRCGPANRADAN